MRHNDDRSGPGGAFAASMSAASVPALAIVARAAAASGCRGPLTSLSFAIARPAADSHGVTLPSGHARISVLGPSFADPPTFLGADSGRWIDAICVVGAFDVVGREDASGCHQKER